VTDGLADTPMVARLYCPVCEPNADPSVDILDVLYCEYHLPPRGGVDDASVVPGSYLSGHGEAGGEENRRWCDLLRENR
jgi:hypothetical protein